MSHRPSIFVLAATPLLIVACGAALPTKPEATAALLKAPESTFAPKLTRTLPAASYCSSVDPNYSFDTMGQMDFVEMFQNLKDKEPLNDATRAGAVLVEFKRFPFNPAGLSPDPSCDAAHAEARKNGQTSSQARLAMVRTALTPKGTATGVELGKPIEVATREVVDVTDIRTERGGVAVTYKWAWKPTTMGEVIGYKPGAPQEATARFRRTDGGWIVEDAGVRRP